MYGFLRKEELWWSSRTLQTPQVNKNLNLDLILIVAFIFLKRSLIFKTLKHEKDIMRVCICIYKPIPIL